MLCLYKTDTDGAKEGSEPSAEGCYRFTVLSEIVNYCTGQADGIRCVATQQRIENETNSLLPQFVVVFSRLSNITLINTEILNH